jgi:hypothetical protein
MDRCESLAGGGLGSGCISADELRQTNMKAIWTFLSIVLIAWSIQLMMAAQVSAYTPPAASDQWASTAEHLTLTGALIVAVSMLWRELGRKDSLLVQSTATVTQALATSAFSNAELRKILEGSVHAKEDLTKSIELLSERIERLPCTEVVKTVKETARALKHDG